IVFRFDFFFFSSRRRHTSFSRDWSSDVCSSDLKALPGTALQAMALSTEGPCKKSCSKSGEIFWTSFSESCVQGLTCFSASRSTKSEERRVGKECRLRWWPYC